MNTLTDSKVSIAHAADERGSSLIEVLIATLIFTVAFLNIAQMVMYSIIVARNADMTTTLTAAAVDKLKTGAFSEAMPVVIPVGVGVLVGVIAISNLVRWTLRRHELPTLGVLMGLLFGSVIGIYPFRAMTPGVGQVAGALGLCAAGFVVTKIIDRIGAA